MIGRRGFLSLIGIGIAAPAIVKASSLMPVKADIILPVARSRNLLTIDMITRESIRMFTESNAFLWQYDEEFAASGAKIGSTLRIRLPSDYTILEGPGHQWAPLQEIPQISASEAAVVGSAAILAKNPTMSRRFWA